MFKLNHFTSQPRSCRLVPSSSRFCKASAYSIATRTRSLVQLELEDAKRNHVSLDAKIKQLEDELVSVLAEESSNLQPLRGPLGAKRSKKRSSKLSAELSLVEKVDHLSAFTTIPQPEATPVIVNTRSLEEMSAEVLKNQTQSGSFEGPHYGLKSWDRFSYDIHNDYLKPIFVISDCTGESAAHTCRAALGQFETDTGIVAPSNIVIFRFVNDKERLRDILERAHHENALVVYTLVNVDMVKALRNASTTLDVKVVDLWGNLLDSMEDHLHQTRIGVPLGSQRRKASLHPKYFKMIEAVEFTRKHDDGSYPEGWADADLLLIGVSRSGKTPLSIYLGQRGFRVANLPLVMEAPLPRQLFDTDPRKVVALKIDPTILAKVRNQRVSSMGLEENALDYGFDYASMAKTNKEVTWAKALYEKHPTWLQIDVTLRSVEESAARILRQMSERYGEEHAIWRGNEEN